MASNTYYSPFFPPVEGEGAKGTTVAAVPTTVVQGIQDNLQDIQDNIGDILGTPIFDGVAPPKVTGLVLTSSITIGAQGESVVALTATWNKITTVQASDLGRYDLQIKENNGNFVLFTTGVDKENTTTQSYQWSVRANQSFTVQVRGVDYPGNVGAWSDAQTLVSAKDTVPPAVPTSLNAETSLSSIFLRWLNPADLDLDRIQVYESTTNNSASAVLYATVNATAGAVGMYTRTGLPAGTTRWFFLKAVDLSGNVSGFSTGLQVVVPSLSETDFTPTASGITPVLIVTTLPTSGNYEGRTAMYQGKLYRYTSGAWTTAVAAVDISGQITNPQIADLAINTAKFANGIEPVTNVTSVPSVKSTSTIFNTTDGKLYRWNGTAYIATTAATDISGTLDAAKLTDGTLDVAKFVAGQEPIKTVTSVPGTKSTNTIYNSTDGKLYRWNGTAYVASVPTVDLVGTISTAQIATNAIDSTKLANGLEAVTVVTSVPGTKSTNTIYNSTDKKLYRWNGSAYIANVATSDLTGTISNAQIATNAIDSTKLAAGLEAVTVVTSVPGTKSTNTVYNSTDGKLYRWNGTAYVASIAAGDVTGQLTDAQVAALSATKITGTVVANQIADGVIGTAKFASGLEPVTVVSSVPATKSTTTIVNSTDGKLYRWSGGAYVASVPAADVSGQLTDAQVAALSAAKITGTISGTQIAANAVDSSKFASGIEPISVVTSVPSVKSTTTIVNSTDGKLYRWSGGAYVASVPAVDIAGQLTDAQVSALSASKVTGTLSDTQLAAISAAKVTGQITGTQITDTAITTAKLAAGAVTTAKITAGAVTANEIASGSITTAKLTAGAITANEIASGAVTTAKITAGAITANEISANAVTTAKLAAGAVTATQIAAGTITSNLIAANAITARELEIGDFTNYADGSDFEDIYPWTLGAGASISTDFAYTGTKSLKQTGTAGVTLQTSITAKPGDQFYIRFYWMTTTDYNGTSNNSKFRIGDQSGTHLASYATAGVQTAWKEETRYFTVPAGVTSLRVTFPTDATTGSRYVDQIEIRRLSQGSLIVDGSITGTKLLANTITATQIAAGTITANEISAGAITTAKLAAGAVTANEIAANTITTAKIAAGAVTANEIAAGSIVASKLAIRGENLWPDSYIQDLSWWKGPTQGSFASGGYVNPTNDSNLPSAGWRFLPDVGSTLYGATGGSKGFWDLWSGQSGIPGFTGTGLTQIVAPSIFAKSGTTYEFAFGCSNASNKPLNLYLQYFNASGVNVGGDLLISFAAGDQTSIIKRAKFTLPSTAVSVRAYWETPAGAAFSGAINVGNISLREAASGTMIVDGTITAGLIAAGAITTAKLAAGAVTANEILGGTITAAKIASNTITGNEIAANAITAFHITTNAITAGAISAGAIVAGKLAVDAVAATNIAAGAITSGKIAADAITSTHISAGAVTAGDLAANAVTAGTIAASAITSREISAGAITTSKLTVIPEGIIADPYFKDVEWWTAGGVDAGGWYFESGSPNSATLVTPKVITLTPSTTAARKHCWSNIKSLATNGTQSYRFRAVGINPTADVVATQVRFLNGSGVATVYELAFPANTNTGMYRSILVTPPADTLSVNVVIYNYGQVPTGANKYASIGSIKLDLATDAELIVDGSVVAGKIATNAVTAGTVAANAITAGTIAANAVTAGTIAANAVTAGTISAGAVTAGKIATDAVTATTIAAGAVTVDKLAANSITSNKLSVQSRPFSTVGFNMRVGTDNKLYWDAGYIQYQDVTGAYAAPFLSANTAGVSFTNVSLYIVYLPGNTNLDYTTNATIVTNSAYMHVATWNGGSDLTVQGGVGTIINGGRIVTGSISADKIVANSIGAGQLAADSITAGQIASGAITTAELASGAITTDKLAVGTGANMLVGAGIGANPNTFMRFDYNPDNVPFSRAANGNYFQSPTYGFCEFDAGQYSLPDSTTFAIRQSNSVTGSVGYCDSRLVWQRGPDGVQADQYPVEVGKTYEASIWSGAHRCKVAIYLEFRNAGNQTIGYSADPPTSVNNMESAGGNNLNSYKRIFARAVAPTGAAWVCVLIRKYNTVTGTDSWMFLNRPMLGVTSPNATELLSWSAPGHSVIQGDAILTGTIHANRISAGTISTNELGAQSVTAAKIQSNSITSAQIAADTITAGNIAAGAIGASEVAAGAITASKVGIRGENLFPDPYVQDYSWWKGPTQGTLPETGRVTPSNDANSIAGGWQFVQDSGTLGIRVGGGRGYWQLWSGQTGIPGYTSSDLTQLIPPSLYAKPSTTYEVSFGCTNGSNKNLILSVQFFNSSGGFMSGLSPITFNAGDQSTIIQRAKFTTPANCVTVRIYWDVPAGAAYSGFINVGNITLREAAGGTMIVDGSITAAHIVAGSITSDRIQAGTITGDRLNTGTNLPGSITVGNTGVSIATVKDTAELANTNATNALNSINIISSDGWLSKSEKPDMIRVWNEIYNTVAYVAGSATNAGISTTNLYGARDYLANYLGSLAPAWNDANYDTPVNGAELRNRIQNVYNNIEDVKAYLSNVTFNYANDPAYIVNNRGTNIDPGRILISGGTTLANWRGGGDNTQINGGAIAANTINANKLTIGLRGVVVNGLNFETNRVDTIYWGAGDINYYDDNNTLQSIGISGGAFTKTAAYYRVYVWWNRGQTFLNAGTEWYNNPNDILLAVYYGGTNMNVTLGRTIIDGDYIKTGSIYADRIQAGSISSVQLASSNVITQSAQIGSGVIQSANIGNLQVKNANIENLTVGTDKIAYNSTSKVWFGTRGDNAGIPFNQDINGNYLPNSIISFNFSKYGNGETVMQYDVQCPLFGSDAVKVNIYLDVWQNGNLIQRRTIRMEVDGNNETYLPFLYQHLFTDLGAGTYEARFSLAHTSGHSCNLSGLSHMIVREFLR